MQMFAASRERQGADLQYKNHPHASTRNEHVDCLNYQRTNDAKAGLSFCAQRGENKANEALQEAFPSFRLCGIA